MFDLVLAGWEMLFLSLCFTRTMLSRRLNGSPSEFGLLRVDVPDTESGVKESAENT